MSLKGALASLNESPPPFSGDAARPVWLVKVHGPYTPFSQPAGVTARGYDHFFVIVDATSMQLLSTGSGPGGTSW